MLADKTLKAFISECLTKNKLTVLDIGCGINQEHTTIMKQHGLTVFTNDFFDSCDYKGKFVDIGFDKKFDAIWCSHCLEHQENVGQFLKQIKHVSNQNALISITVPPDHGQIVGGHLTRWNLGLLYYNLIVAGFDCANSKHKQYGCNISVLFENVDIDFTKIQLVYDNGDIETLAKFFPFRVTQGFNGSQIEDTF